MTIGIPIERVGDAVGVTVLGSDLDGGTGGHQTGVGALDVCGDDRDDHPADAHPIRTTAHPEEGTATDPVDPAVALIDCEWETEGVGVERVARFQVGDVQEGDEGGVGSLHPGHSGRPAARALPPSTRRRYRRSVPDHPFVPYRPDRVPDDEVAARAAAFADEMDRRRSVRVFSGDPVPRSVMEDLVRAASTAPSGAHRQPWTFVLVGDEATKHRIRVAAEEEERENYEGGRLPPDWREALEPLGTDWRKPYLDVVPWIVVLFEQRYGLDADGRRIKHFYVKESVGIAAGMFITAVHRAGLVTLTHTPSPMAFLTRVLGRPENERPFAVFPVGHPHPECTVPDLARKPLDRVIADPPVG